MPHILPQTLPDFRHASILVIGDVMLDRYWFGETQRISPEAPVPIVKINDTDNRPGGAANVALNIAALGAKVTLLGITGQDEAATILEQQLETAAINAVFCKQKTTDTLIKLRVISRRQQLLRLDFEEKQLIAEGTILEDYYKQYLNHVQLVILSDYQKGTLLHAPLFIKLAREANIPVLVDPKGNDFNIYRHASIITPNLKEFEAIVGPCPNEQTLLDKGRAFLSQYDTPTLLVTRGEDGITLIEAEHATHFPAYAREIVDVTGAGDTVISTVGAAVACGCDLIHATALANLAASITVGKLGAATVSVPELQIALTGKTNFNTGVMNEEQLLQAVKEVRVQGKKIIFTNGCFDILHASHVICLQLAKQLGDYLIVAVNTDDSIQKLKGLHRPINHLEHRMTVLAGLGVVDWVIPFADDTPERLLRLIQPDLLVKGGDYQLDQVVGAEIVRAYGGEVRIVNTPQNISSTHLIHRLQAETVLEENLEEKERQHG